MRCSIMLETDAPWCDIRPSHASHRLLGSLLNDQNFEDCKKAFAPGSVKPEKHDVSKMVKGRNEPCTIGQVGSFSWYSMAGSPFTGGVVHRCPQRHSSGASCGSSLQQHHSALWFGRHQGNSRSKLALSFLWSMHLDHHRAFSAFSDSFSLLLSCRALPEVSLHFSGAARQDASTMVWVALRKSSQGRRTGPRKGTRRKR
jgi:hypothetical protein